MSHIRIHNRCVTYMRTTVHIRKSYICVWVSHVEFNTCTNNTKSSHTSNWQTKIDAVRLCRPDVSTDDQDLHCLQLIFLALVKVLFFSIKKYWYFSYDSTKTCCGYSLEAPTQGASNEYNMFTGYPPLSRPIDLCDFVPYHSKWCKVWSDLIIAIRRLIWVCTALLYNISKIDVFYLGNQFQPYKWLQYLCNHT